MASLTDDPVTRLAFSVQQNPGVYALLLGSGISFTSGILTGWGITLDLVRKVARADGVEDQADWYRWYKATYGQEPDYSHLLERLAPNPAERQPIIQAYLEPARDPDDPDGRKGLPTVAHQAIARLVKAGHIKVIITTNFDRLLEMALTAEGIQPTVIASEDACQGAVPLPHSPCTILKLHGDVLDIRSLNTAAELDDYKPAMKQYLDRILDEYGLIVCGWSADWDPALRAAFQHAPSRRYSTWWTSVGEMKPGARSLVEHRRAVPIPIAGADGFFQELEVKVATLARLNQPPPAATALVVAMAKRYLQRPEHRIDLADLVQRETERLLATMKEVLPQVSAAPADPQLPVWRDRCEAAVETLASVLGTIGRWGADDPAAQQLGLGPDAIRRCLALWKDVTGPQRHNFLAAYPPLFLFHAYGLGLVQARRWQALWDFLLLPLGSRRQWPVDDNASGPMRMAEAFLLRWWLPLQIERRYADDLTGRQGEGSPALVTERVWERLQPWLPHFLGDVADRSILHERLLVYAAYTVYAGRPDRISDGVYKATGVRFPVPFLPQEKLSLLLDELRAAANIGSGFGPQDSALFQAFKSNLRGKVPFDD